jgi:hypothetical protein
MVYAVASKLDGKEMTSQLIHRCPFDDHIARDGNQDELEVSWGEEFDSLRMEMMALDEMEPETTVA